jgi:hypothetical protein
MWLKASLDSFVADARLRSAATWQTCWLKKLLEDELGGSITISESDGLPVDFIVSGISYSNLSRAKALINRYKLYGRSYVIQYADLDESVQWLDALCEKEQTIVSSVQWVDAVCEKELNEVTIGVSLTWTDSANGATDGMGGSIKLKDIANNEVDFEIIEMYAKMDLKSLSETYQAGGFKVDLQSLIAFLGGFTTVKYVRWDTDPLMSDPTYSTETGFFTEDTSIYVEVQTEPFI